MRSILILSLLGSWLATGLLAQDLTGPGLGQSGIISPFNPDGTKDDDDGSGGGGGGSYVAPGDAGSGSLPTTPSTAVPPRGATAPPVRGQSGRAGSRAGGAGTAGSSARGSSGTGGTSVPTLPDDWRTWWETNKFDFIDLRRVVDAPWTGQGPIEESALEKARRLADVADLLETQVGPALRPLTRSKDVAVRASAIVALAKLGDAEAATLAREMLQDRSLDARRAAMLALGLTDSGRTSYLLLNIATDSNTGRALLETSTVAENDRGIALLSAALRHGYGTDAVIDQLLSERDGLPNEVVASLCQAAGLLGSPLPMPRLIDVALDDDWPQWVRSSATDGLGRIGDPSVLPALVALLNSGLEPKRAATLALGNVAHPSLPGVVARLAELMQHDSDLPTRHFAAISLGRVGGSLARAALESALDDDPPTHMRPWLGLGLALCERQEPSPGFVPRMDDLFEGDGNVENRGAYLIALGLAGRQEGLPVLQEALASPQIELAGYAAMALGLSGLPDAQPLLRDALSASRSPVVQRHAALGLGILGDATAIPDLIHLLRTTANPFVASYAAIAVGYMGDADAVGPLLNAIAQAGEEGVVTTTYAVAAVGQLFDVERRPALSRLAARDNYLNRPAAVRMLLALGF